MQKSMELSFPSPAIGQTFAALTRAMEACAIRHAEALAIDHDRILADFGCLWMLTRFELRLNRQPKGALRVRTFLRAPSSVFSLRDFDFWDERGACGTAVQCWVLVDERERHIRPISTVPLLLDCPTPEPQRKSRPGRFRLPDEMKSAGVWTVAPEEIDDNGHLNNVAYTRHAEELVQPGCTSLCVSFERECFLGERLLLKQAQTPEGFFVQICKENGEECFRACFGKEILNEA